jgi:oxygen-independent coproporphyrinogen III oxidase
MAGIYLHIPFCKKACHYCNFHFSTQTDLKEAMVQSMLQEIEMQKGFLQNQIQTIYFGGGTPSLLSQNELAQLLNQLHKHFSIAPKAELTLEANPDDIDVQKLTDWKSLGINRLSIGVQSFVDEDLQWMNRAHDAGQAERCIHSAQDVGISNLSIDLIYGSPTLTNENWEQNLATVAALNIPHLSSYALTVEPKTALDKMVQTKQKQDVDPEKQAQHFLHLMDWAASNDFEHYEISNLAKPNMRSQHNSSYWQGEPYLGIGPSAHSFNGKNVRQWNISNNALYMKSIEQHVLPAEKEELTTIQQLNEYIMTSLRTMEGLQFGEVIKRSVERHLWQIQQAAQVHIAEGKMREMGNALALTNKGKLFADGITASLFVD